MKERSPIAVLLLSLFVPFYILYWLYETAKILRARGTTPPSLKLIFGPILALFGIMVISLLAKVVMGNGSSFRTIFNVMYLVLSFAAMLLVIVLPFVYYYRFSQAADKATGGKASATTSFILFILISGVATYIIQDSLNQTASVALAASSPIGADIPATAASPAEAATDTTADTPSEQSAAPTAASAGPANPSSINVTDASDTSDGTTPPVTPAA